MAFSLDQLSALARYVRTVREAAPYEVPAYRIAVFVTESSHIITHAYPAVDMDLSSTIAEAAMVASTHGAAATVIATDEYRVTGLQPVESVDFNARDAFYAGDLRVSEQLGVVVIEWDAMMYWRGRIPYRWTPVDEWEWGPAVFDAPASLRQGERN